MKRSTGMRAIAPGIVLSRRGLYAVVFIALVVSCGSLTTWAYSIAAVLGAGVLVQSLIDLIQLGWQPQVSVQRSVRKRLLQGHDEPIVYEIQNLCPCPLRMQIREAGTVAQYIQEATMPLKIQPRTRALLTHTLHPRQRGTLEFTAFYLIIAPGLGFFERRFKLNALAQTRVYPDYTAIGKRAELQLVRARSVSGSRQTNSVGGESERTGVRTYTDGDPFRAIDFQATARTGRMMVKEYEVERGQNIFLAIDGGRLMTAPVGQRSLFDHALGVALGMSNVARSFGDRVGVHVFADRPLLTIPARSGAPHLAHIAQALRQLQPVEVESDYYQASAQLGRHFQKRGTIFVMSHVLDHLTIDALLSAFTPLAQTHRVVFLFMDDGIIDEYATQAVTSTSTAVETAVALRLQRDRATAFHLLRKAGMEVLAHHAEAIGPAAIDAYVNLRQGRTLKRGRVRL